MLLKPTGLLGSGVVLGKAKGKGKVRALMHAPNVHMLVVQRKVSVRSEVPFFRLMKVNPVLPPVCQSDDVVIIVVKVVGSPHMPDESGPSAHATKCGLCKKNKQPCIRLPGHTCNECTKAKAKCNK